MWKSNTSNFLWVVYVTYKVDSVWIIYLSPLLFTGASSNVMRSSDIFQAARLSAALLNEVPLHNLDQYRRNMSLLCISTQSTSIADEYQCLYSIRYRGLRISYWAHGSCCLSHLSLPRSISGRIPPVRTYSAHPPPPTDPPPHDGKGGAEVVKERALAALQV